MFAFVSYRQYVLRIALCVSQYVSYRVFPYQLSPTNLTMVTKYNLFTVNKWIFATLKSILYKKI